MKPALVRYCLIVLAYFSTLVSAKAGTPAPAPQLKDPRTVGALNLIWENDAFLLTGASDKHYTNGIRLEFTMGKPANLDSAKWPLNKFEPLFKQSNQIYLTGHIGHNMYTPRDTSTSLLQINDRPYAAWLYGGLRYAEVNDWETGIFKLDVRDYTSLELNLGVIGPWAQGDGLQNWIHDQIGSGDTLGWDHQISNEVVFDLNYFQSHSLRVLGEKDAVFSIDVEPFLNLRAGSVHVHGGLGLGGAIGLNHTQGATSRRLGYSGPLGTQDPDPKDLSIAVFGSIEGRGVAWNTFLEGPIFGDSVHTVDTEPFIWHAEVGVMARIKSFNISYMQVMRSDEFDGQEGIHQYGQFRVGCEWRW
ncbi:MAG: lipid A 3-O-deacylase [Verrucomicrobiales bacterium]|jgi:lipid A 3-O-deacylase